jgi:hypothetical protein
MEDRRNPQHVADRARHAIAQPGTIASFDKRRFAQPENSLYGYLEMPPGGRRSVAVSSIVHAYAIFEASNELGPPGRRKRRTQSPD